jgi:hypothetical protein
MVGREAALVTVAPGEAGGVLDSLVAVDVGVDDGARGMPRGCRASDTRRWFLDA